MTPIDQLRTWLQEAHNSGIEMPEAMNLATVDPDGAPSARMVLLRGLDERGPVFYTNSNSRKGRALQAHPRAALTFHWEGTGRQVRIEGPVSMVSDDEADAYFASRPRPSQIGAWASDQSSVIPSREFLMGRYAEAAERFEGREVDRPPHWRGYRVDPHRIEFWEHGAHRLHDRTVYTRENDEWVVELLAP
jgi:pyridoxamine 5'-phosphate oxidase